MKYTVLLFFSLLSGRLFAQTSKIDSLLHNMKNHEETPLAIEQVINHINEPVYIYDTIKGYKVVNDTLKLLYIGRNYPNQKLTILVKGKKSITKLSLK